MTVADALVSTLRDWGIRYVFGVSGANIEHIHDAIHRLGDGRLASVLARSEIGAAFMADARARVHTTLGVCCATSGGGMMNLAVGVAEAYAESVPLLAIVGQTATALEGKGAFQDASGIGRTVNGVQLWRAITKETARIDDPAAFWTQLHHCVRAALEGRRGPVALLIPRDLYTQTVPPRPAWFPNDLAELRAPVPPEAAAVEALAALLARSQRPVLVLGTGVSRCDDPGPVLRFAQASGIAVVTTMGNPGAYDNDAPNYLGMIGVAGHPSAHDYLNHQADCIVAVGTGLDIMVRAPIAQGLARAALAVVNVDPGTIDRALAPAVRVVGDAGATFAALLERAPAPFQPTAQPITQYVPVLASDAPLAPGTLLQSAAIERLQRWLPQRGHLLFDAGNCAASALHYLRVPAELSTTIALGMGGMGYAIAAAVGAQLGSDRPQTVVLCGDGALLMQGFEMHTALELGLPILFVVFNNSQHGMCVTRQELFFEGRLEASAYPTLSASTVGRGLGLWGATADTLDALDTALAEYDAVGGAGVLELRLRREEKAPFTPFLDPNAPTRAMP
jgi:acetolactate synthase-1/2/3 large subunit